MNRCQWCAGPMLAEAVYTRETSRPIVSCLMCGREAGEQPRVATPTALRREPPPRLALPLPPVTRGRASRFDADEVSYILGRLDGGAGLLELAAEMACSRHLIQQVARGTYRVTA